jgi:hypothetical protein
LKLKTKGKVATKKYEELTPKKRNILFSQLSLKNETFTTENLDKAFQRWS